MFSQRAKDYRNVLLIHLNINSIQNRFEELKELNAKLKVQLIVLSETKIDKSYPSEQFEMDGYQMFRNDRKKGEED